MREPRRSAVSGAPEIFAMLLRRWPRHYDKPPRRRLTQSACARALIPNSPKPHVLWVEQDTYGPWPSWDWLRGKGGASRYDDDDDKDDDLLYLYYDYDQGPLMGWLLNILS